MAVARNMAVTQYRVLKKAESLWRFQKPAWIEAMNGGMAIGKYPMGSDKSRLEKNASIIMLAPAARAI